MSSFQEWMREYKKQMERGIIQKAYKGLMEYLMGLRVYFKKSYPSYSVSGSIYFGYMDMSYFSISPQWLKSRKLKIALVFIHETVCFEVWLAGSNRKIQKEYWKLVKESGWDKYHLPSLKPGVDSIIEYCVAKNPDYSDLNALTMQIEKALLEFIKDVEDFFKNL
ncbi:MAG: hypothetical protein GF383_00300 [Candidatus Lokiarchaeota archaeon]|nr:hypothetical protein [Candidatus Lokiarchaeota archaeon]